MNKKKFQTFFEFGFSKIRASTFNKNNPDEVFFAESELLISHSNLELETQKIISSFEKDTNEYIDSINFMVDSPKMLSIAISVSKKLEGSKLKQSNVQFLIQEAKQQILKYNKDLSVAHIIINNYKIDDINYSYLPDIIECHCISLDILFICLPSDLILYFKNIFSKSNILINQNMCTSYAKAVSYKDNLNLYEDISFIDIGFNKTSITTYIHNKISSLNVLPIGGNHITQDISKVLSIGLENAENLKISFNKNKNFLESKNISSDLLQKVILARTEEIIEICSQFIDSNLIATNQLKIILMGEGAKILDKQNKDNFFPKCNTDFLEETTKDICRSGFKLGLGINKQEVIVIPKKVIKQGFFEKLFHLFK